MVENNTPSLALRSFMSQIIDYAGLYPPASLSLEDAFHNFVNYQTSPEVWMLARFVVPAKRLGELTQLAARMFPKEGKLPFTALGRGGKGAGEFFGNLNLDLADITAFRSAHGMRAVVDVFETALPASELGDPARSDDLVQKTVELLHRNELMPFFEVPFGEGWQDRAQNLIRSIQRLNDKTNQLVGYKLRTGGVTPNVFPSPEQVAWAIAAVRDAAIPMKATAGLHHPIRHYNESVQTKMHGFLNVFGAGVLAEANHLNAEQIQVIIEDEDPADFRFDESGFAWKKLKAGNGQIAQARRRFTSFGSCSFDEPREDLKTIGLLPS